MAGRPRAPGGLSDQLQLRCTPSQKARWRAAAGLKSDIDFHEWVRRALDVAADAAEIFRSSSEESTSEKID